MRTFYEHIKQIRPDDSEIVQRKTLLNLVRSAVPFTIKAMADEKSLVTEQIISAALREPRGGSMLLTKSLQAIFAVRTRDLAGSVVDVLQFQTMLDKRDSSLLGSDARQSDVQTLARHLRNELNSLPPTSRPVLDFLSQVDESNVLKKSTEEWTMEAYAKDKDILRHSAQASRGVSPFVFALVKHSADASLAQAARPDENGMTSFAHQVANNPLIDELPNVPNEAQPSVVDALLKGDQEGAYQAVLKQRNLARTRAVIYNANIDTSKLDSAGFVQFSPSM